MHTESIEYQAGNLTMQGFLARKPSDKPQPIIMVVHDWTGCREPAHERAKYFAHQGYVGFAVDMFGKGKRGSDTDRSINQKLIAEVLEERQIIVSRLQAALECALNLENINPGKIVTIGFCFGGLCALDFARAGAKIDAAISVHGLLMKPETTQLPKITAKILALHGYLDKSVTPDKLAEFEQEMTQRNADWQTHVFGKAMHAFTNPKLHDVEAGLMYDPNADAMTWGIVKSYIDLLFI